MVLWRVKREVWEWRGKKLKGELELELECLNSPVSLQYNISPQSGEAPKSRSLERKQQDPIVLTKWRHSTYVLDLNDKVRHGYKDCWVWLLWLLLQVFHVVNPRVLTRLSVQQKAYKSKRWCVVPEKGTFTTCVNVIRQPKLFLHRFRSQANVHTAG